MSDKHFVQQPCQDDYPKLEHSVSIVLVADQNFVAVLYTCMQSILLHASPERTYDIYIFHPDINDDIQQIFQRNLTTANIRITFVNVNSYVTGYQLKTISYFTTNTFFRFLIPEILKNHQKVLYLDCDTIVCDDLAKLYDTELGEYLIAATSDADYCGNCNKKNLDFFSYTKNILHMENPFLYFQAGVLLMNVEKLRQVTSAHDLFTMADSYTYRFLDQDILNIVCYNQVLYVDMKWNLLYDCDFIRIKEIISFAPHEIREQYMEARKAPSIIHYAGLIKPWHNPSVDFGHEFWTVARMTPFYEVLLSNMQDYKLSVLESKLKQLYSEDKHFILKFVRKIVRRLMPENTRLRQKAIALYQRIIQR